METWCSNERKGPTTESGVVLSVNEIKRSRLPGWVQLRYKARTCVPDRAGDSPIVRWRWCDAIPRLAGKTAARFRLYPP
ncbi:hypothetical protein GWI33_002437 [Rhynchophorus ferrugineus]|uniref:Uncharacterized protein n=1 Tax=Rhynchophorus ferrugineus TaxID=354439 RepID=A0A834MN59_RHYFE|nr:hypothetical protein GWI33_002437 [Rhynchophorus ferrugineus]